MEKMMILTLIFLWPYFLLAIMVWEKMRKGFGPHDLAGFVGAAASLLLMTAALSAFPFVYTWITGDRTANIGWGLLCIGSIVYCCAFLTAGFRLGRTVGEKKASKRTPNNRNNINAMDT